MKNGLLDLTSFEKAINSLDEIIIRYDKESFDSAIRDAVIQRFEYTYSLSVKMIKRYFNLSLAENEEVDAMDFNQTIRQANQMGLLLSNLEKWTEYRQKRNLTSHTYDEKKALEVVAVVKDFEKDAKFLFNELKKR